MNMKVEISAQASRYARPCQHLLQCPPESGGGGSVRILRAKGSTITHAPQDLRGLGLV